MKNNWIREGMTVCSKHWPKIRMVVDSIERKIVEGHPIPTGVPGMKEVPKKQVIGVYTHWIAEDG